MKCFPFFVFLKKNYCFIIEAKNTHNTSNKKECRICKLASLLYETSRRLSKKPMNDNLKKHTKS